MMTRKLRLLPIWFLFAAVSAFLLPVGLVRAQSPTQNLPGGISPAVPKTTRPAKAPVASPIQITVAKADSATVAPPNRAQAYYHLTLASIYEDKALAEGRPEYVNQAIEEYKLALNADPASPQLNNALAELYFRTSRIREAENTARTLLKNEPDNIDAHKLLGRIYLHALSEGQNAPSSTSSAGNALDQAIAEFEKIVALQPKNVEERLVLGQLYTVKHDQKKAEEQFKIAQSMEPDSEIVVLNLARLYAESGDFKQATKVIEAVAVADRTAKMEDALGASYEQLKQTKDAIAAYQRAADQEPGDPRTLNALAQALLSDNQLDEALKQYKRLAKTDPENIAPLVRISEIQRRQGKYEDALATIRKARQKDSTNLEAGYNEGLLLDVLGRYDESAQVYDKMVDQTSHANGAYTNEEKANRSIFLERLGAVYQEQNKVDQAIATFQKMVEMGGDSAISGLEGQVDTYINAKLFDKAEETGRKAVAADPKDWHIKLMLAGILVEEGKNDEGLTLARGLLGNAKQDQHVWLRLGQFYTELHRWKEAEEAFNKAEELTKKKEDKTYLLFLRGALAERQKHYEPAEQFFRQALELDPANAMTLNYLGYMLADKSTRFPEALKLIRKAVELEPMNGAYLDSLGWVYFKMGEYELAEDDLCRAVERDRTDPTVHDHLGDLYEKTGRIRLAAAQWEISLAQFAKSASIDVEPAEVAKVKKKLESARVRLAKENSAMGGQPKTE
jgi:tetratricopeptide (TPR) repeat protein